MFNYIIIEYNIYMYTKNVLCSTYVRTYFIYIGRLPAGFGFLLYNFLIGILCTRAGEWDGGDGEWYGGWEMHRLFIFPFRYHALCAIHRFSVFLFAFHQLFMHLCALTFIETFLFWSS